MKKSNPFISWLGRHYYVFGILGMAFSVLFFWLNIGANIYNKTLMFISAVFFCVSFPIKLAHKQLPDKSVSAKVGIVIFRIILAVFLDAAIGFMAFIGVTVLSLPMD